MKHCCLHNVLNLIQHYITSSNFELVNLSESVGSKLACRSFWDALYAQASLMHQIDTGNHDTTIQDHTLPPFTHHFHTAIKSTNEDPKLL